MMRERRQGLFTGRDRVGGITEILQQQEHDLFIHFIIFSNQDAGVMDCVRARFARGMVVRFSPF